MRVHGAGFGRQAVTAIQDILVDPRYGRFAADCCERGRQVVPDAFPWKCMGMATEEFLALPLRYASGRLMDDAIKAVQLKIVRSAERLVEGWWTQWLADEAPEPASREEAVAELNPCRAGYQRTLF